MKLVNFENNVGKMYVKKKIEMAGKKKKPDSS